MSEDFPARLVAHARIPLGRACGALAEAAAGRYPVHPARRARDSDPG